MIQVVVRRVDHGLSNIEGGVAGAVLVVVLFIVFLGFNGALIIIRVGVGARDAPFHFCVPKTMVECVRQRM